MTIEDAERIKKLTDEVLLVLKDEVDPILIGHVLLNVRVYLAVQIELRELQGKALNDRADLFLEYVKKFKEKKND